MKETGTCSICKNPYDRYGNNPEPILSWEQRCCDVCNAQIVVPVRIFGLEAPAAIDALRKYGFRVAIGPKARRAK